MTSVGHIIDIFSPHFHPHFSFWAWNISNAFEKLFINGLISTFISVLQPSLNWSHSASFLHASYKNIIQSFYCQHEAICFYSITEKAPQLMPELLLRTYGTAPSNSIAAVTQETERGSVHDIITASMELFRQSRIRVFTVKWNGVHAV